MRRLGIGLLLALAFAAQPATGRFGPQIEGILADYGVPLVRNGRVVVP